VNNEQNSRRERTRDRQYRKLPASQANRQQSD
jgi:hypothetical protein